MAIYMDVFGNNHHMKSETPKKKEKTSIHNTPFWIPSFKKKRVFVKQPKFTPKLTHFSFGSLPGDSFQVHTSHWTITTFHLKQLAIPNENKQESLCFCLAIIFCQVRVVKKKVKSKKTPC